MTDTRKEKWEVSHEKNDAGTSTPAASDLAVEEQTDINEKALLRKVDMRVLPVLTILYLLSFLDRSNGVFSFSFLLLFFSLHAERSMRRLIELSGKCAVGGHV